MNLSHIAFLWFASVATVSYFLFFEEPFEMSAGSPIARVSSLAGEVQRRPGDYVIWRKIAKNSPLYEGDYVSTGDKAATSIAFEGGREITLQENSQALIKIGNSSNDYLVTLISGSLNVAKPKLASNTKIVNLKPIIVQAGQNRIKLSEQSHELAISQSGITKTEVIKVTENLIAKDPEIKNLKPVDLALDFVPNAIPDQAIFEEEESPSPTPLPNTEPVADVKALFADFTKKWKGPVLLDPKVQNNGFYSSTSFLDSKTKLQFKVNKNFEGFENLSPKLFLKLESGGKAIEKLVDEKGVAILGHNDFRSLGYNRSGAINLKVSFVAMISSSSEKYSLKSPTYFYRLSSLTDFPEGSYNVKFAFVKDYKLEKMDGWFVRPEGKNFNLNTEIKFATKGDFLSLSKFFFQASDFEVIKTNNFVVPETGKFFSRANKISAYIEGKNSEDKLIAYLTGAGGFSLSFEGKSTSFVSAWNPKADFSEKGSFLQKVNELIKANKAVYVVGDQGFYKVNQKFLTDNEIVAKFVNKNGRAIFTEQARIIEIK